MNSISKKTSLILLAITAIVCSRVMFLFFNDPEGPNLVVVIGAAVIIYVLSLIAYLSTFSASKKLGLGVVIQILAVAGSYFFLL